MYSSPRSRSVGATATRSSRFHHTESPRRCNTPRASSVAVGSSFGPMGQTPNRQLGRTSRELESQTTTAIGAKKSTAGTSSAAYRTFDTVPQRGFFAPCKCAAPVIAFSEATSSVHFPPPAASLPPALRPAMEGSLLPAFSLEQPPKLILGGTPAKTEIEIPPMLSLDDSMTSLAVASTTKGRKKKKSATGKNEMSRAAMTSTAAAKLLAGSRGNTYNAEQESRYVDVAGCTSSGLHSTLWVGVADGSIEVRSLADPTVLLNVISRPVSETGVSVTALLQIGQNKVIAGDSTGLLRVMSAQTGELLEAKKAHTKSISCMSLVLMPTDSTDEDPNEVFYPRASVLLTGSLDGTIAKWDGVTLECLGRLTAGKKGVTSVAGCSSGCYAFSGCEAGIIRCWNLMDNTEVKLTSSERQALIDFKAGDIEACSQSFMSTGVGPRGDTISNTSFQDVSAPSPHRSSSQNGVTAKVKRATTASSQKLGERLPPFPAPLQRKGVESVPRLRGLSDGSVPRHRASGLVQTPRRAPSVSSTFNTPARTGRKLATGSTAGTPVAARKVNTAGTPVRTTTGYNSVGRVRSSSLPGGASKVKKINPIKLADCEAIITRLEATIRDYQSKLSRAHAEWPPIALTSEETERSSAFNFEFPIQSMHKDQITGLEIIDDRFLISCSRDMNINVFVLPSGRHVKTLRSDGRRSPLSKVVFDRPTGRLFVFSCDGDVVGFNMRSSRMEPTIKLSTGMITPMCTHTTIQIKTLHRFYILSTETEGSEKSIVSSSIAAVAQVDRNISAPAKKKKKIKKKGDTTTLKTAVGEPSTEEVEAALTLSQLQRTCLQNRRLVESVRTMGSVDDMEIEDLRKCGVTFQRWRLRHFLQTTFLRWQRWAERRMQLPVLAKEAEKLTHENHLNTLQYYYSMWLNFRRTQSKNNGIRTSQLLEARTPWTFSDGAGWLSIERERRQKFFLFLARKVDVLRLQRSFSLWLDFLKERQIFESRQVAYNRLLLSFSGSSLSSTALVLTAVKNKALRLACHERAVSLLDQRMKPVHTKMCKQYFLKWLTFRAEANARNLASGWKEVTVSRPQALLSYYFLKWMDFARNHVNEERLRREGSMLKQEWLTLQNTMDNPRSAEDLQKEVVEKEEIIVRIAYDKDIQNKKRLEVEQELADLRIRESLRTFLAGFDPWEDVNTLTDAKEGTPSISTASTPHKSRSHQRTRSWFKALGGLEESLDIELTPRESATLTEGAEIRRSVLSVLRALKGCALHFGRDYVKVSVAFEATSTLSITDTNLDFSRRSASTSSMPYRVMPTINRGRSGPAYRNNPVGDASFDASAFSCISDAFDGVVGELVSVIYAAAREAGIDPTIDSQLLGANSSPSLQGPSLRRDSGNLLSGYGSLSTSPDVQHSPTTRLYPGRDEGPQPIRLDFTPRIHGKWIEEKSDARAVTTVSSGVSINWLQFVSLRTRQEVMELVAHLLLLHDSFMVHNENMVADSRGAQALPLSSLCSTHAAQQLVRHAALVIELLHPQIWQRQLHLNSLKPQDSNLDELPNNFTLEDSFATVERPLSRPSSTPRLRQLAATPIPSRTTPSRQAPLSRELLKQQVDVPPLSLEDSLPPTASASAAASFRQGGGWVSATTPRSSGLISGAQSPSGSVTFYQARSYADPEDDERRSMRSLGSVTPRGSVVSGFQASGKVCQRPFLGFRVEEIDYRSARAIRIKEVSQSYTTPNGDQAIGPACAAGLQVGDQFVRFAHYAVTDLAAFNAIVTRHVRPGAKLPVVVQRNRETFSTTLRVAIRAS